MVNVTWNHSSMCVCVCVCSITRHIFKFPFSFFLLFFKFLFHRICVKYFEWVFTQKAKQRKVCIIWMYFLFFFIFDTWGSNHSYIQMSTHAFVELWFQRCSTLYSTGSSLENKFGLLLVLLGPTPSHGVLPLFA